MPTSTYIPLATVTLGSSASSVTFSSIPATFRDLVVVVEADHTASAGYISIRLNGDSTTNYPSVQMQGSGSGVVSGTYNIQEIPLSRNSMALGRKTGIAQIMDYSATDKHKTVLGRQSGPDLTAAVAGRYPSTSAITSVTVFDTNLNSFIAGSTFSVYGIAA